ERIRTPILNLRTVARYPFTLQAFNLAEAERFERSKDFSPGTLAECCHTIRRRFQTFSIDDCQMPILCLKSWLRSLFPFQSTVRKSGSLSFSGKSAMGNRKLAMNWRKVK